MNLFRAAGTALLLAAATAAFAWVDSGHMVVAAIAEGRLKPDVLKICQDLLENGPTERTQGFIQGACWPDDAKNQTTGPWHYIDLPFRTDGKPTQTKPDEQNVVWAIQHFSAILKDKANPKADRAEALRYLIHFVGDLHQPLHATSRESDDYPEGDRGGNDFKIVPGDVFSGVTRPPRNLHQVWDLGGGLFPPVTRPLDPESKGRILILAQNIAGRNPMSKFVQQLKDPNPMAWAKESLELAKTVVYHGIEPGDEPSVAYVAICKTVCAQRAALAGYRLADLLNRLLGKAK